ncbi:MAG TPA: sigma-70 family RNA polymerase sigma factor [Bryobacteraceae bacterium]|nr:sigma-70 family RNA polymerase sigma factor [Bryobacteraceae bacterium]
MSSPRIVGDVTQLLKEWSKGNQSAAETLTHLVYAELRKLACGYMRSERDNHTLQPTALIHEAWVRLVSQGQPDWHNRSHFFRFASHLMRQVLVDHARSRRAAKRGSGLHPVTIEAVADAQSMTTVDVLALDKALSRLASLDESRTRILEMRYFGGLTEQEIGDDMDLSIATVRRHLRTAEAWLFKELSAESKRLRTEEPTRL